MPSDARITLSSLLSSTALRLAALVAAAMSAGYLWRAAVEPGGTGTGETVARAGLPARPPVISFDTLDLLRSAEPEAVPGRADEVATRTVTSKPRSGSSVHLVSVTVSGPQSGGSAAPAPVRSPSRPVRTTPKPKPPPNRGQKPRPRPKPAPPPRRNPPPPPAPKPPPPKPPPPPPPPVGPPAPPPPPPPPVAGGETRPGWGKGDRNHRHSGPPGQQKPKQGQGNSGSQGQGGQGGGGHGNGRGKGKG